MKVFTHTLQTSAPMLFGPASRLAEIAACYPETTGILEMGNRCADISQPLKVMSMGIRKGDKITVSAEGPSETEMIDVLHNYFDIAM